MRRKKRTELLRKATVGEDYTFKAKKRREFIK